MSTATTLRRVSATRYATPLREGGSLPGLVEADDDGLYVVKFRGAGQGPLALVAEIIVGELARAIGLRVPELALIEVDAALAAAEPDPEIQELVQASHGTNLAVDFLPGAITYSPANKLQPDPDLAAAIVWLDALTNNVDRTARNTNMLIWHQQLWLIDHGAALYLQHGGLDADTHAERPFEQIADHVLLDLASSIDAAHQRLAPLLDRELIDQLTWLVPNEWWIGSPREQYVGYLWRRLEHGGFAEEAENVRAAA